MELIKKTTRINFLGYRKIAMILSIAVLVIGITSLVVRGLNFGIDFTGGTMLDVAYTDSVDITEVRGQLSDAGFGDALVQYFGTSRDLLIRLPVSQDKKAIKLSDQVMDALRKPFGERLASEARGDAQLCVTNNGEQRPCSVQMRRSEFVGPQVGEELKENGGLAMIYALIGVLIYVAWRFEWRFAVGSVVALAHDVLITISFFSITGLEFSLVILAAVLAVIGYSLNDTIVVFDRIRENFRKMRKGTTVEIMNTSINQTLRRTLLTSFTTLLVVLALLFLGGQVIHGFAIALLIGIFVGTYSSIFIASPVVLSLGVSRQDLMTVKKEGADQTGAQV